MRALLQRVTWAQVVVAGEVIGRIEEGLLVLLGIGPEDGMEEIEKLGRKILQLRIFHDDMGKMNRSVTDIGGGLLVVSQFTLHADTRKGNRPSFTEAAPPELAHRLYEAFVAFLQNEYAGPVATGRFGAEMHVSLLNHGPVTIWLDTDQWKNPRN